MNKLKCALSILLITALSAQSSHANTELVDGVKHIITSSLTDELDFNITLDSDAEILSVYINGDDGDGDIYITNANGGTIDCANQKAGSSEGCVVTNATPGTYGITVKVYNNDHFTNLSILASTTVHSQTDQCLNTENTTILRVQNPDLTSDQLSNICHILKVTETLFNSSLDIESPVINDQNDTVNVNIYANQGAYQSTGDQLHDLKETSSTGIYLESNPESEKAQANVITFEARRWANQEFFIWELGHEYVHYLDGRYNKQGDYGDFSSHNLIWWTEGLAEYISDNDSPYLSVKLSQANDRFTLAEIVDKNGSADPYRWGATLVKYFIEQRPKDVTTLRSFARNGQYTELDTWLQSFASENQENFDSWFNETLLNNFSETAIELSLEQTMTITSQHGKLYYIDVVAGTDAISFQTRDGGGNANLYIAKDQIPNPWSPSQNICRSVNGSQENDNDEQCGISTPEAGRYYVLVDAPGNAIFVNTQLTASHRYIETQEEQICQSETPYTGRDKSKNSHVSLVNNSNGPINIYWLSNTSGARAKTLSENLAIGQTWTDKLYLGDKFVIASETNGCRAVGVLSKTTNQFEITDSGISEVSTIEVSPAPESKDSSGGNMAFQSLLLLTIVRLYRHVRNTN
ncbi:MAG: collagenase [Colwelliaceae bacterium]|nr:collagenase [Colwelliaceae bacterium]